MKPRHKMLATNSFIFTRVSPGYLQTQISSMPMLGVRCMKHRESVSVWRLLYCIPSTRYPRCTVSSPTTSNPEDMGVQLKGSQTSSSPIHPYDNLFNLVKCTELN